MADDDLRAQLRTWEQTGEGHAALEAAYVRVGEPLPYAVLAGAPRWRWVVELCRDVCGADLQPEWGFTPEEVANAEANRGLGHGARFCGALREWFLLVGKRVEAATLHRNGGLRALARFDSLIRVGTRDGVWFWRTSTGSREWVAPLGDEHDPELRTDDPHQLFVGERAALRVSDCLKVWLTVQARSAALLGEPGPFGPQLALEEAWFDARLLELSEGRISAESWADWIRGYRPEDPVAAQREAEEEAKVLLAIMAGTYEEPAPSEADFEFGELRLTDARRLIEEGSPINLKRAQRHLKSVAKRFEGYPLAVRARELLETLPA